MASVEHCCEQGEAWAARPEVECDAGLPDPVDSVPPDLQAACVSTWEVCCGRARRTAQCERGAAAARAGSECGLAGDSLPPSELQAHKDCCLACHLGILAALTGQVGGPTAPITESDRTNPFRIC